MGKRAGRLTIGGVRVRVRGGAWVVGRGRGRCRRGCPGESRMLIEPVLNVIGVVCEQLVAHDVSPVRAANRLPRRRAAPLFPLRTVRSLTPTSIAMSDVPTAAAISKTACPVLATRCSEAARSLRSFPELPPATRGPPPWDHDEHGLPKALHRSCDPRHITRVIRATFLTDGASSKPADRSRTWRRRPDARHGWSRRLPRPIRGRRRAPNRFRSRHPWS